MCFLAGNLALGATKGLTKQEAEQKKSLTERDLQDLQLAEDLGKTCYEMYAVTATRLAPEIVYFNIDVSCLPFPVFVFLPGRRRIGVFFVYAKKKKEVFSLLEKLELCADCRVE